MGIFKNKSSNHTCPMPRPLTEDRTEPLAGGLTFHELNMAVSGACAGFACLSILILMCRHALRFSKPSEQLKIMRICALIPMYSFFAFISIVAPVSYAYIAPWIDVVQAIALGDFFLLMLEFISPNETRRDMFFSALVVKQKKAGKETIDGMTWYRKQWICIFQYVVVSVIVAIVTCITEGANVYCLTSSKPYFAHLWLNIVHTLSLVVAVLSVLRFYMNLKTELAGHKPLAKLLAFKLLVGLTFLLKIIFWILEGLDSSPLDPSATLNYADVNVGIPLMVLCLEMVPFSIFFHYAYDVKPYLLRSQDSEAQPMTGAVSSFYQGGVLGFRAWLAFLNPAEIVQAIMFAFSMYAEGRRHGARQSHDQRELVPVPYTQQTGAGEQMNPDVDGRWEESPYPQPYESPRRERHHRHDRHERHERRGRHQRY